jgi:quercetin dioxygenase-like cupin family protein
MHPHGEELVVCVSGSIELVQEVEGSERTTTLRAGEWIVNGVGVWHTANIGVGETAVCMFITSGLGTQGRER